MTTTRMSFGRATLAHGSLAAAAVLALAATPAQAVSLVQAVSANLTTGGAYNGQFDISSYLSSGGDLYRVTGAKLIAKGSSSLSYAVTVGDYGPPSQYDSQQRLITPSQPIYQTFCNFFGCYDELVGYTNPVYGTDRYYNVDRTITRLDALDQMAVDVGQGFGSGVSQTQIHTNSGLTPTGQPQNQGPNETGGFDFYRPRERVVTDAWYGPISATANLTANDLVGLNSNGFLDFAVTAQSGRFTLTDLEFQFDLEKIEPAAVPEPGTWALVILGLGMAGARLRRRRPQLA
ncbi:PEPxxWA-CTERM sorting domain-containing protein [Phenylobacterium sp.]|uniref:PEPxxWA-CTERM sorting domain-containing protein n=1 Tax=Phenylobacterium sp. TaxID=1871053 RepID=UPI0025CE094B|nr:PEPxxWA-CTERM sorting domain-containing protein [Phenylobacterium sp.]